MSIYDDLQSLTAEIIGEFKQGTIRYCRMVPGSGPVDDPGPSTPVYTAFDGVARGVKTKYVMNGLAVASDLQVTMPVTTGISPNIADFVEIDGISYKIMQVIPKPAAGTVVAYTLIVRK